MPSKKKYSKRRPYPKTKKVAKKQRYQGKMVLTPKQVFPQSICTSLRYADSFNLDPSLGGAAYHIFRANDIYDPNYTGGGHQPRGFDEWMTMYNKFVVIGSKITAHFTVSGTGNTPDYDRIVGIKRDTTTTGVSGYIDIIEEKRTNYGILAEGSTEGLKKTMAFSTKKWFNGTKPLSNPRLQGTAAAGPDDVVYYHVYTGAIGAGDNPIDTNVLVQIDYQVVFFDPITPGTS